MLRVLMLDGVGGEVYGADVVTIDKGAPRQRTMRLLKQLMKPRRLSDVVSHNSALERETTGGRFKDHEMRLSPSNTTKPDVDRRVSGQPAQSTLV
jgi:hypothetical protein